MARPKKSPSQQIRAYDLHKGGFSPEAILGQLEQEFDKPVSLRTVERWTQGFKRLPAGVSDSDAPFQWHLLEKYGLPWEASEYLLEMWAYFLVRSLYNPKAEPPPTVRQVHWWWRVRQAAPDIDSQDVWWIAQEFVVREIAHQVLAQPLEMADVEVWLALKPWSGEDQRSIYLSNVKIGLIPPLRAVEQSSSTVERIWQETGKPHNIGLISLCVIPGPPEMLPSQRWEWMEKNQQEEGHER
jgi:hypothetical protein